MGHAEVAETPAEAGDDVLPRGREQPCTEVAGHDCAGCVGVLVNVLKCADIERLGGFYDDGNSQQGNEHQNALKEVSPADGLEAAEEGVADDDERVDEHCGALRDVGEQAHEHGGACDQRRGDIHGEGNEEYDRTDDLKGLFLRNKAVCQVLGNGDCVVCGNGQLAQPLCAEDPVSRSAECKADAYPDLAEAESEDRAGQTHEQPRRHIRRLSAHCGDPRSHGAAAEEVVALVLVAAVEEENQTDEKQDNEVSEEYNNFCVHVVDLSRKIYLHYTDANLPLQE